MWSSRDVRAAVLSASPLGEVEPETIPERVVSAAEALALHPIPRGGADPVRELLTAHALYVQALVTRYGIAPELARFGSVSMRSTDHGGRWIERTHGAAFLFSLRLPEENDYRPLPRGMALRIDAPSTGLDPMHFEFLLYDGERERSNLYDPRDGAAVRAWLNRAVRGRRRGPVGLRALEVNAAA